MSSFLYRHCDLGVLKWDVIKDHAKKTNGFDFHAYLVGLSIVSTCLIGTRYRLWLGFIISQKNYEAENSKEQYSLCFMGGNSVIIHSIIIIIPAL